MSEEAAVSPRQERSARSISRRPALLLVVVALASAVGYGISRLQRNLGERAILTRALVTAVQNQDEAKAVQLLEQGADPNATFGGELPQSLLQRAAILLRLRKPAYTGDPLVVEAAFRPNGQGILAALLKAGADQNAPGNGGATALHWAAFNHDTRLTKMLLQAGANPNARALDGSTPLHLGVSRSFVSASSGAAVTQLLLQARSDPNAATKTGLTPLMSAASSAPDPEVIRLLLEHRADPARRDSKGQTARDYVIALSSKTPSKSEGIVEILKLLPASP